MHANRIIFIEREIRQAVKQFLISVGAKKHIAFYGAMGAGKTRFITAICNELGTNDLVSSPTFAIVNEYTTLEGLPIYHFDFYRIKSSVELFDIGFDEYCRENAFCFIEWPEKGEEILPDDFIRVLINELPDGSRELSFLSNN